MGSSNPSKIQVWSSLNNRKLPGREGDETFKSLNRENTELFGCSSPKPKTTGKTFGSSSTPLLIVENIPGSSWEHQTLPEPSKEAQAEERTAGTQIHQLKMAFQFKNPKELCIFYMGQHLAEFIKINISTYQFLEKKIEYFFYQYT